MGEMIVYIELFYQKFIENPLEEENLKINLKRKCDDVEYRITVPDLSKTVK